jgi:thiamine kinase-like enzyme
MLLHEDGWSVIDFDGCAIGDPYWEIGMFLALLPRHVAALCDAQAQKALLAAAREAYLRGYRQSSRKPLDEEAVLWSWICGEIFGLARLTKRDLYRAGDLERSRAQICELLRELCGPAFLDRLQEQ